MIYVRSAPYVFDASDALVLYDTDAKNGVQYAYEEVLSEVPEPTYQAVKFSHSPSVDTESLGNVIIGGLVIVGTTIFVYTLVSTGAFVLLPLGLLIA